MAGRSRSVFLAAGLVLIAGLASAQSPAPDFTGLWEGTIVYSHAQVEFDATVELDRDSTGALVGTIDIPSERIAYRPLRNIAVSGADLKMEFLNDSEVRGPNAVFRLEGTLAPGGKAIHGAFIEKNGRIPFTFTRRGDPHMERPPEPVSEVHPLADAGDELKAAFNRDTGSVRLILLLSPT
ncbi:MAG TPA: hypothetical protein VOA87_07030 [Thermoanaerobaculia bacterium]|nr:hypothetical protein [Thermoanaerobaculia bacterium]